jgi:hypothetical protein
MIYKVPNFAIAKPNYVCPDQATVDEGIAYGYVGNFSIGTSTDADAFLAQNQQDWLTACADRFSVCKDIDPDPIQTTWVLCNLNTELPNTDQPYEVFNTMQGIYQNAVGLDNAKQLLAQTQQEFINSSGMGQYYVFDHFTPLPPPPTEGLQTL